MDIATREGEIITVLATDVAKTEDREGEIVAGLAVDVATAKTGGDSSSIRPRRIKASRKYCLKIAFN